MPPYRVRARRPKMPRHVLTIELVNGLAAWTREQYAALRDELLAMFADRLDLVEPLWRYEPGVPDHLRTLPPQPDPRPLMRGLPEDVARFELEQTAHGTILAGRGAWLEEHMNEEEFL